MELTEQNICIIREQSYKKYKSQHFVEWQSCLWELDSNKFINLIFILTEAKFKKTQENDMKWN